MYKTFLVLLISVSSVALKSNNVLNEVNSNSYLSVNTSADFLSTDYFIAGDIEDTIKRPKVTYPFVYNETLLEDSKEINNLGKDNVNPCGIHINSVSSDMLLNIDLTNKSVYIPYAKKYFALTESHVFYFSDTVYNFDILRVSNTVVNGFDHKNLLIGFLNPTLGNEILFSAMWKENEYTKPYYALETSTSGDYTKSFYFPLYNVNTFASPIYSSLFFVNQLIADNTAGTLKDYTIYYDNFTNLNFSERKLFQESQIADYVTARGIYESLGTTNLYKNTPVTAVSFDYPNDKLTGLVPVDYYSIKDTSTNIEYNNLKSSDEGSILIDGALFGKTVEIKKGETFTSTNASDSFSFSIPARPLFNETIKLDYFNENIVGFSPLSKYNIYLNNVPTAYTSLDDGSIKIQEEWFGQTLLVQKIGNETQPNSVSVELLISARPSEETPVITVKNLTDTTISLEPVPGFEFSLDEITRSANPTFNDLNPESFYTVFFRKSATENFPHSITFGRNEYQTKMQNINIPTLDANIISITRVI